MILSAWAHDRPLAERHNISFRRWYRQCIWKHTLIPVIVGDESYGGFTLIRDEIHAYMTKPIPLRRYFRLVQYLIDTYGAAKTMALKENEKACIFLQRLGFRVISETEHQYQFRCTALHPRFERSS